MDWNQRLNAVLDYLEGLTDREPDTDAAAALAHCSPFHFLRMFEVVTGLTLGEYSRRRRLSRAAIDLVTTDDRILDVALRYGYETPEAFTRAFRRLFGCSPTEARRSTEPLPTWPPLRLRVELQGGEPVRFRIVEQPAFEVVGWALRTGSRQSQNLTEIPAFWNACLADGRAAALLPLSAGLGHVGLCCEWDSACDAFTYVVGVDRRPGGPVPDGARVLGLPSAVYAVFESRGPLPGSIQAAWVRAFQEWFPTSGWEHAGSPDFEVYPAFAADDPRGDPGHPECFAEVWVPIRRRGGA